MLRHVSAPAHAFAQIPNVILRHPRLSPDAKTLLTWQLSLPAAERQCLSDTARRAGIGKTAFQRAKRQLLNEGYLHEWRTQTEGGRFVTVQLVSNTPLGVKEALAVRDGLSPAPGGSRLTTPAREQPSASAPAAGEPTDRAVGRQPIRNTEENTSPPTDAAERSGQPESPSAAGTAVGGEPPANDAPDDSAAQPPLRLAEAESLLRSLAREEPCVALPTRTARRWAPLAARWLASGLEPDRIRRALTDGLGTARSPVGVLRWRLEHALPEAPPATADAVPRPVSRVTGMRECRTRHTQPRLFTPPPDGPAETLCPDCRGQKPEAQQPPAGGGFAAFAAARRAGTAGTRGVGTSTGERRRRGGR